MPNKICSVSFNLDDPDQTTLYHHAMKRSSFSGYVKRLIQRDLEGGNGLVHSETKGAERAVLDSYDIMKGFV